jgi:signal transduction histidine kinase
MTVVSLWSFGFFLTMFAGLRVEQALWCSRISHLFGGFTGITFWLFVSAFIRPEHARTVGRGYIIFAIFNSVFCVSPWMIEAVPNKLFFPYYPEPGDLYWLYVLNFIIPFIMAFISLGLFCRDALVPALKRKQALWTLGGVLVGWSGVGTLFPPIYNVPLTPTLILLPAIAIAVLYAIVRHRFLDIEIVLRRSLVYSGLIACITAAYLLVILITERWFQGYFGYRSFIATLVVAFLTAIFFNPLRERIQAFVDRGVLKATPAELATQREQLLVEVRKGDQQKAVATLAAGLAHEIKNPLTAIKTFTEHLGSHYEDPAFRAKFQKIVGGEVERINLIVQQLLEFAKPVPPKLAPLQLSVVLDETLEFLGSECAKRQVTVLKQYHAQEPILGDAKQLKQVFLNLVLNSLQSINGRGGQLTVEMARRGSELIVTLADTGCGIPADALPRIFEPFYTTKPQGTGLGLSVVQGIIQEHGGRLNVASEVGRGTVVVVSLPVAV